MNEAGEGREIVRVELEQWKLDNVLYRLLWSCCENFEGIGVRREEEYNYLD